MEEYRFNIKHLVILALSCLLIASAIAARSYFSSDTTIVFCDVGQGDASYIRIKNTYDVLVDTGPDKKVLSCLSKYMPFYDRTIDAVIITHPQKDHMGELLELSKRYAIGGVYANFQEEPGKEVADTRDALIKNHIPIYPVSLGAHLSVGPGSFEFLWPSKTILAANHFQSGKNVLGASTLDPNVLSLIVQFSEGQQTVLYTGDIPATALLDVLKSKYSPSQKAAIPISILKLPHHGSINGINKSSLLLAQPTYTVISVGKYNSYGHPSLLVIKLLESLKKTYYRTDKSGDVVFAIENGELRHKN